MGTKSKNINEKNMLPDSDIENNNIENKDSRDEMVQDLKTMKLFRTIVMIFLAMALALSFLSGSDFKRNKYIFKEESVYSISFLGDDIDDFTRRVLTFGELYKTEDYVKDPNNITVDELSIAREFVNQKIQEEYEKRTYELYEQDTSNWDEYKWTKEQNRIREEVTKELGYDDDKLKALIVEEKIKDYVKNKNYLDSQENLKYIVYDRLNNIWLSNYEGIKEGISSLKENSSFFIEHHISGVSKQERDIYINGEKLTERELNNIDIYEYYGYYNIDLDITHFNENNYYDNYTRTIRPKGELDIYIAIPKQSDLVVGDNIYSTMKDFHKAQSTIKIQLLSLIGGILISIILITILNKIKYKGSYFEDLINKTKDYPIEFNFIELIILFIIKSIICKSYWVNGYRTTIILENLLIGFIIIISVYVTSKVIILKYKEGQLFKDSYLVSFYEYVQVCLEKRSFGRKLFMILAIYVGGLVIGGMLLILGFGEAGLIVAICGAIAATILFVFTTTRDLAYLNKITKSAKDICEGKTSENIPEKRKGALRDLAHSINNMKEGLRISLENETKSERMKTELITNVSHDLKTPLTSIINYVDLLKRCDVKPEEAKAYVEVLDKKSQRLKILIDDLFEASKAASGAMQLTLTRVEVIALLRQTLGEAEGRIEKANLDFKLSVPKEKVYIKADGRKIWRVFENLISNIIKYSLQGTRVYIDVTEYDGKVYITMKNISSYELNFNPEEITERFKRGEESRHTEGSGLGLAIAKNIVGLHGGEMKIDIDGDLFKSTVIFDVDKD